MEPVVSVNQLTKRFGKITAVNAIAFDIHEGEIFGLLGPNGAWQGSRLVNGGKYALLGTTMAPGFDPQSFELGIKEQLIKQYPDWSEMIGTLCRNQ